MPFWRAIRKNSRNRPRAIKPHQGKSKQSPEKPCQLPHLKQVSRYGRHRGQFAKIFPETSRVPSYFVPLFFVAGLFIGPLAAVFVPQLWVMYFVVLAVYLLLLLIESVNIFITELSLKAAIYFMVGIFWTHVVYGVNFLIGLVKKPKFVPKKVDFKTGKYLEG